MSFTVRLVLTAAVAIGLLAIGAKADAAEPNLRVGVHAVSQHLVDEYRDVDRSRKQFNNSNYGLYASYGDKVRLQVGSYKNSYRQQTNYVAISGEYELIGPVSVGAFVGLGTGYRKNLPKYHAFGGLNLLGGATVGLNLTEKLATRLLFVPGDAAVVHMTIDYQF